MTETETSVQTPLSPPLRLNIGAGGSSIEGFTNLDIKFGYDAAKDTLPYPDGSVSEIYCSHMLEHLPFNRAFMVIGDWVRVLKPGGRLRIAVPDHTAVFAARTQFNREFMDHVLMGGQTDKDDFHRSCYDEERLRYFMGSHGIGEIKRFDPITKDDSNYKFSLNLEGIKRHWETPENPRITPLMVQPRLCFSAVSERMMMLYEAMREGGMKINKPQRSRGAFWERDIELGIEEICQRHEADFILFCDYDGLFDPADVQRLVQTMHEHPEAAAVGSFQMSRHDNKPLVYEPNLDYTTPVTRVRWQHFGLTLIRTAAFFDLPKPWFWSVPGTDQEGKIGWGAWNRSDGDITFWRIMLDNGMLVLQDNRVVIGHLVECVKWPRKDGSGCLLQPLPDYERRGKPAAVGFNPEVYKPKPAPPVEAPAASAT